MDRPNYLRDEAAKYRQLAEEADDPMIKNEVLELASVCEEVANDIEDRLTGGYSRSRSREACVALALPTIRYARSCRWPHRAH